MKKWVVAGVCIAGVAGYGLFIFYKKPADTRKEDAFAVVSAADLVNDYIKNESKADKNFAGKVIIVSGIISEVRPHTSVVSISLSSDDVLSGVTCIFYPEEINAVLKLKIGDRIRIKGKCNGKLMDVVLNDCSIVN